MRLDEKQIDVETIYHYFYDKSSLFMKKKKEKFENMLANTEINTLLKASYHCRA